MAWKGVVKFADRNQFPDFLCEVRTHIVRRSLNFAHQFGPAVHNGNQVFKISAPGKIILSSARKSFEFRSAEIYRRD